MADQRGQSDEMGTAALASVKATLDAIDKEHEATANPKYCDEGTCGVCQIVGRLYAALRGARQGIPR